MKLSFCCGVEELSLLHRYGVRAVELSAAAIVGLSDEAFEALRKEVADLKMNVVSVNCLIGGITPLREAPDFSEAEGYLDRLFPRLQALSVPTAVFGSGGFRHAPEDRATYLPLLDRFLKLLADKAQAHGVTIALEPLNQKECNILNTTYEGFETVKRLDHPALRLLCDLYHFDLEHESLAVLADYEGYLRHVHIALPVSRFYPTAEDGYDYRPFLDALRNAGYEGYVSVEGNRQSEEAIGLANRYLSSLLGE